MRTCRSCGRPFPLEDFYELRPGGPRRHQCRACFLSRQRVRHMGARAAAHGITPARVEELQVGQDGACAICGTRSGALVIDHDPLCCPTSATSCGRCVRGLVCTSCRRALELWPRTDVLAAAARYVFRGDQARQARGDLDPHEEARLVRVQRAALEAQRAADRNQRLAGRLARRTPEESAALIRQALTTDPGETA